MAIILPTEVLTLGKLGPTNVVLHLLLWHSFFDTRQANCYAQMTLHSRQASSPWALCGGELARRLEPTPLPN